MNLTPQPYQGEEKLRAEVEKLKAQRKRDLDAEKERVRKVHEKGGQINPWPVFLLILVGIAMSVGLHFYAQPETFSNHLILSLLYFIFTAGSTIMSFIVWQKMRAKG